MIIARATLADLPAIVAIERQGFTRDAWSESSWRSELESADRYVLVARDATDEVVGVATFQAVLDVADLHRVVVRADQRGRGIGRRLVGAGFDWASALGVQEVMLEVELDNAVARHLYEAVGFMPVARRGDYYGPGRHALVMSRALAPVEWLVTA